MKLYIKRDQDDGMLGGISFILSARVELLPEELELIKKYKAHKTVLLTKQHPIWGVVTYKVEDLIKGIKTKCKDISEILESENLVKETCKNFYTFVKVMASFGGEEIIEYYDDEEEEICDSSNDNSGITRIEKGRSNKSVKNGKADEELTFCYHCGEELSQSSISCPKCGKEL